MIEEKKVPTMGESVTEVTVANILKKTGDYVEKDMTVVELESDKVTVEVNAETSGQLDLKDLKVDQILNIGDPLFSIDTAASKPKQSESPKKEATKPVQDQKKAPSSGIVSGSQEYLASLPNSKVVEEKTPEKSIEEPKKEKREAMSPLRKAIAKRLVKVKNETAMLTTFNEVDMSAVMNLRKSKKEQFLEKHNLKLSFMPFFIYASMLALKEYPDVGAFIDGTDLVYHDQVNIGIAVSTDNGLVVPVLYGIDKKSFVEIAEDLDAVAMKARSGKLKVSEMSGGQFTITNGGVFGSLLSTPILNPPQSAILGMHTIQKRPVAISDRVEVRPMMYLALSYDHRVIDGKDSVSFLKRIKEFLEEPSIMILES